MRSSGGLGVDFHGDNTGSNPVGDANKINNLGFQAIFPGPPRDQIPLEPVHAFLARTFIRLLATFLDPA